MAIRTKCCFRRMSLRRGSAALPAVQADIPSLVVLSEISSQQRHVLFLEMLFTGGRLQDADVWTRISQIRIWRENKRCRIHSGHTWEINTLNWYTNTNITVCIQGWADCTYSQAEWNKHSLQLQTTGILLENWHNNLISYQNSELLYWCIPILID